MSDTLTLTPEQGAAIRAGLPIFWIRDHCQIVDKRGRLVPLIFNAAQEHTERVIHEMEQLYIPVRVVVLKARQHGETTRGTARIYHKAAMYANRNALIASHDADSSVNIFRRVQLMHKMDPAKRPTQYSNRREITFDSPHNSVVQVETAGNDTLGRSATYHDVHLSELAFYPNPDNAMLSVSQCVPDDPDTCVCAESTANGVGGYFYNLYKLARRPECDRSNPAMIIPDPPAEDWNGYLRVFNPWYINPEYSMAAPTDFVMSRDEVDYARQYDLSRNQMYWRRYTINSKCGGDEDKFRQEYPANDQEAFVVSGRLYFPGPQLETMLKRTRKPLFHGSFTLDGELVKDELGPWDIFDDFCTGNNYAVGADTAEGLDELETNDPEKTDRSIAHVVEVSSKRQAAKLRCRMHEDLFAEQIVGAAKYYGQAYLAVETNSKSGGATIEGVKRSGYDHLFYAEKFDENGRVITKKIGWNTDKFNRPMMLNDLRMLIRDLAVLIYSESTVMELLTFCVNKDGQPEALPGEHDDEVMSYAIAIQCALFAIPLIGDSSEYRKSEVIVQGGRVFKRAEIKDYTETLAVTGAVDSFEDMNE